MTSHKANRSGARNPWPITIIVFFFVFVSGLVSFIVFAATQHVDLVRSDYYEEEIRFQDQLDRLNRTHQMAPQVKVVCDPHQHSLTVYLPPAQALEASGHIHLYRPSDARLDQEFPLRLSRDGSQRLDTEQLRSGLWKVRVEWAVAGQEFYYDAAVMIKPAA